MQTSSSFLPSSASITQIFSEAFESAIPDRTLTVSEWAAKYRWLSAERSARAAGGRARWDNTLTPYLKEIMDAASDPAVREIVFVKPNQVGGTECMLNAIGYYMHIDPTTQLYSCESEEKAEDWSKEALATMIRDSDMLRGLVKESRSRDSNNTIRAKRYPGGQLAIGWATSANTATSRPRRIVYLDERDKYPKIPQGDYCELAILRTETYQDEKLIFKASTPGDRLENPPGTALDAPRYSPIEREYLESDRRKFFVPCLHCETFQTLKWSQVTWDKDHPLLAYYACPHCGAVLEEEDKEEMLAAGEWRAEAEFRGRAGFFLNKLYSLFVTWGEVAESFLRAKRSGDIEQLKVWINNALAEGWQPPEEKIQTSKLEDRREDYGGKGFIPIGVCLLTCGVDVQIDRLELEVVGWGLDYESWSIEYLIIPGDPARIELWEQLKALLVNEYLRADGVTLRISCTAIDSGGHHTQEAYRFAHENRGRRVFVVKGASTPGRPLVTKPSIVGRPPVKLFLLGTETAKDTFFANLRVEDQGPGYCHFPLERAGPVGVTYYDSDYFKQLLSERPLLRRGVRVYVKIREAARNEALDNRVYNMGAYAILNPDMRKLHRRLIDSAPKSEEPQAEEKEPGDEHDDEGGPAQPPPASSRSGFRIPRRRGGFVNNWR